MNKYMNEYELLHICPDLFFTSVFIIKRHVNIAYLHSNAKRNELQCVTVILFE